MLIGDPWDGHILEPVCYTIRQNLIKKTNNKIIIWGNAKYISVADVLPPPGCANGVPQH